MENPHYTEEEFMRARGCARRDEAGAARMRRHESGDSLNDTNLWKLNNPLFGFSRADEDQLELEYQEA